MYKYYIEIASDEHMLNAAEIADIFNIKSVVRKPHMTLVHVIIKDYLESNSVEYHNLFYNAKSGLMKVYPAAIYTAAVDRFKKLLKNKTYKALNGKEYKVI